MRIGSKPKPALIGIPDHQGVYYVGGRVGAARGPAAFRKEWQKFARSSAEPARDWGDVQGLGLAVPPNLESARDFISEAHRATGRTLVIGGGNDHAWSQLAGVSRAMSGARPVRLGCINIDCHLDVRKPAPHITSGSPFYLALEDGTVRASDFIEFGIQAHCNAPALWEYVESKNVKVIRWEELRNGSAVGALSRALSALAKRVDAIVVCFDLDSIAEIYAPGVSAPQSEGLSATEAIQIAELCGAREEVVSFGIYELNPEHDRGERTARLAATMGWHWAQAASGEATPPSRPLGEKNSKKKS